jgi:hypothetical protein
MKTNPIARRTRVIVRKVGPWSVLRWSLFFYFCVMLIFFFAAVFVYGILQSAGVLSGISKLAESAGLGCTTVPAGQTASCHFEFHSGYIFSRMFVIGVVLVLIWSVVNMLISILYNLVSEILGGIELTLVERR